MGYSAVSFKYRYVCCIYDAPTPEAIRTLAGMRQLPEVRITEVSLLNPYFHQR